jgi:tRNA threonylcarbamoyl adenosine modification protein YjeE
MIEIDLPEETATHALGVRLAALLKTGDFVALHGGLGAGKTMLSRGIIRALLGADVEVPSPTYTLVQTYEVPEFTLWHFDLYRIENAQALTELGWDETEDGVALVEWPERAEGHLPKWRLDVRLSEDGTGRKARLEPHGEDWQNRMHGFAL